MESFCCERCFSLVNRVPEQGNMPHLSYLIYSTWPEPDRKLYSDFQGGLLLKKKVIFIGFVQAQFVEVHLTLSKKEQRPSDRPSNNN